MNARYDKYLVTKYQPLYRDRFGDMKTTAMCWGFEIQSGWFDIIDTLSYQLCSDWLYQKERYDAVKGRVGELKYPDEPHWKNVNEPVTQEMIDDARRLMDEEAEKIPVVSQVKEKFGGLRFYVYGATDEQYGMIRLAEAMSYKVCEVCGSRGKPNRDGGWISTRCKEHRDSFT